ncbi:ABC transporter permease [Aestuariivirga sp.]|uniref:ABC transporter permease n=1 Tax=Aestuariivirga sp. TaxID=2650926 RepID=UPI0039E2DC90
MTDAVSALNRDIAKLAVGIPVHVWRAALAAAVFWLATAVVTIALPDVVPWGSGPLFAALTGGVAALLVILAFTVQRLGKAGERLIHYGPWFVALGVWLFLWELATAKFGWLPKPFFSPPHGLLNVYVSDGPRLLICILYSLRLWALGFFSGIAVGYVIGLALGWSPRFSYWGMPVLKLIGPVPASAWIPVTFYFFPTTFAASIFIVALSCGIPVAILTASGVGAINKAYYDVANTLGAKSWYQIRHIAIPGSLPHVFVGLFMGLYFSFAILVVAEMLGAKYGLGWYIQFQTAYSGYANVYATLIIMALLCAGLVKLLFIIRGRLLRWQAGFIT